LAVTPDAPAVTEAPTKDHASKRGTTPAPDTVPSGSQRASTIAFIREGNIWLMDPDGADQRQLSHSGKCAHPSWSPDGKSLVFESSGDVWRMELPNQRLQRLTTTGDCHQPAWRPGTDEVWYLRFERVSEWQGYWATIWAVASAGTARKVARIEDRIWEPTRTTWRADGKLLALDIVVANSDVAYAGFFAPDGSQLRIKMEGRNQPWAESVAAQLSPSWCPTDQDLVVSTVVYWGDTPQMPNGSLVVLDQGTGFVRDLMDDREGVPSTPSWSPSGDRIAFCRGSGHSFAVWVIAADGEGLRKIADNAEQPAWSAAP
jgi:Tol biopolymer transport system component